MTAISTEDARADALLETAIAGMLSTFAVTAMIRADAIRIIAKRAVKKTQRHG